jgi:hypothetical protein
VGKSSRKPIFGGVTSYFAGWRSIRIPGRLPGRAADPMVAATPVCCGKQRFVSFAFI